jgi:hypothetical protein
LSPLTAYELIALGSNVTEVLVPGQPGPAGPGLPVGGTTGQKLVKASGANYDTQWASDAPVVIASQAEAEAGTNNTNLMTPLRVAQAVANRVLTSRQILAGTGLTGGGNLTADRTLTVDPASQPEAEAGVSAVKVMTPQRTAQAITARLTDNLTSTSATQALTAAQGKILNDTKISTGRLISAGTGLTGGGDLSADRTISADIASQAEAEAGASNTKLMTPLRVAQAVANRVLTTRTVTAGTGLTGGGDLTIDRTISADIASQLEAETGSSNTKLMTPLRVTQATINNVLNTRAVNTGTGLTGGGNLTADRTISADLASQAEAEAGTSNTKLLTPLRGKQLIDRLPPGIPVTAKAAATLIAADNGYTVSSTSGTWVVSTGLPAGTAISLFNNSASTRGVTQGAGVTLRLLGGTSTGSRTLSAYGFATVVHFGSEVWGISGPGVF